MTTPNMASWAELRTWELPAGHFLQTKVFPILCHAWRDISRRSITMCDYQPDIPAQFSCVPRIPSMCSSEKRPEGQALPGAEQISDLTLADATVYPFRFFQSMGLKWKLFSHTVTDRNITVNAPDTSKAWVDIAHRCSIAPPSKCCPPSQIWSLHAKLPMTKEWF